MSIWHIYCLFLTYFLLIFKFLDPTLLQHKLKELFQTGVYEANMYLMLCAINHSQHIHLSKTEP